MQANEALYPIREVSNLTGVNAITLRAWERRYGLIEPVRTDGGHRLYTQGNIEQIKAAVALTEQGVAISQVKALLDEKSEIHKIDLLQGESDFTNRIMEYVFAYDCDPLNTELDNLFNDLEERFWLPILSQITKTLKKESRSCFVFWESQLVPRLQTRMRFAMRALKQSHSKTVWVESEPGTPQSFLILAALALLNKGYYPYVNFYPIYAEREYGDLNAGLVGLGCESLAFVSDNPDFAELFWSEWVKNHADLTFHFFLEGQLKTALDAQLNCSVYNLEFFV
jgi:DNA-binding transcriptional MerR regulator